MPSVRCLLQAHTPAQNELIIRQNETLLTLLAVRANKKDADLLAELKRINLAEEKKIGRRQS
jgi:hypothetical protein